MPASWLQSIDATNYPAVWIAVVGAMVNVACAIPGCYLVLRRMSLMGDALSHAVLPGLVLAFLVSGTLSIGPLFVGAALVGLVTAAATEALHRHAGVDSDASLGVVFTSLFALGVILVKRYLSDVHFDMECVWQGSLLQMVFETRNVWGAEIPRHVFSIGPVLLLNLGLVLLFWKELKLVSFDSALATTLGFPAGWISYLLMTAIAITTVASFEAVGSILVVAMLIVPAATAHLLTDRLGRMLAIAAMIGIVAAVLGTLLAYRLDVECAGAMTVVVGCCYGMTVIVAPRYGMVSRLINNSRTTLRILREDLLGMLYRVEEIDETRPLAAPLAIRAVGGRLLGRWALAELVRRGSIVRQADFLELTNKGRRQARRLVRTHRLWETYLVEHLGLPSDHVHEPAERTEHFISAELRSELENKLKEAARDPHGREIPHE